MRMRRNSRRRDVGVALLLVAGCAAAGACAPSGRLPARPAAPRPELAAVQAVWMADTVAPGESLAVRIRGVSGPNGSWKLTGIRRDTLPGSAGGVLLSPAVGRVPGEMFIQMEIPLDQVVRIPAPHAGNLEICVAGRDTNVCKRVRVHAKAHRAPAAVRLTPATPVTSGTDEIVPVEVQATIRSGWVAWVEWSDGDGPFQRLDDVQPEGAGLTGRITVRRPPADAARRITVKAIDGQGGSSTPAVVQLPAR